MNFFNKIENLINKLLEKLFTYLEKFIPKKLIKLHQLILKKHQVLKDKITAKLIKHKNLINIEKIKKLKNATIEKQKEISKKVATINVKTIPTFFTSFISEKWEKFHVWFLSLKPQNIVLSILAGIIISLMSIQLYTNSKKIYKETAGREIASYNPEVGNRPEWYKGSEKQFLVTFFNLPIYIDNNQAAKSLRVDFTLESSNRYIIRFLKENEYQMRDRLNSNLEPMEPKFLQSSEGKIILKDIITNELNILLRDKKIEGEIKQVYLDSLSFD